METGLTGLCNSLPDDMPLRVTDRISIKTGNTIISAVISGHYHRGIVLAVISFVHLKNCYLMYLFFPGSTSSIVVVVHFVTSSVHLVCLSTDLLPLTVSL